MTQNYGEIYGADLLRVLNGMRTTHDPRVVAILPCSYLETHLTTLIERKLPGLSDEKLWARFFGSSGMLIDLAKKLDLALALAAIDKRLHKRIVTIARIRNRLAHRLNVTDFDHPEIAPLVDSLASTNTPDPKIYMDSGWLPLLKQNNGGLFIREAMSACGRLTDYLTGGEPFEYTDAGIPIDAPLLTRSIVFGSRRAETEEVSSESS